MAAAEINGLGPFGIGWFTSFRSSTLLPVSSGGLLIKGEYYEKKVTLILKGATGEPSLSSVRGVSGFWGFWGLGLRFGLG